VLDEVDAENDAEVRAEGCTEEAARGVDALAEDGCACEEASAR